VARRKEDTAKRCLLLAVAETILDTWSRKLLGAHKILLNSVVVGVSREGH